MVYLFIHYKTPSGSTSTRYMTPSGGVFTWKRTPSGSLDGSTGVLLVGTLQMSSVSVAVLYSVSLPEVPPEVAAAAPRTPSLPFCRNTKHRSVNSDVQLHVFHAEFSSRSSTTSIFHQLRIRILKSRKNLLQIQDGISKQ